jgi:hypothetical protein
VFGYELAVSERIGLDEAAAVARGLLDGEASRSMERGSANGMRNDPPPLQERRPS